MHNESIEIKDQVSSVSTSKFKGFHSTLLFVLVKYDFYLFIFTMHIYLYFCFSSIMVCGLCTKTLLCTLRRGKQNLPLITFHQPSSWFHCGLEAPGCVNKWSRRLFHIINCIWFSVAGSSWNISTALSRPIIIKLSLELTSQAAETQGFCLMYCRLYSIIHLPHYQI